MSKPLRIAACTGIAALALASFAAGGSHQETKPGEKPATGHAAMDHGKMSPEEQKAMDAMMKAATPGPEHTHLAARAGHWDATVTMWMKPGAPPETMTAKAERTAILGGRVLEERWTGMMMGMPFEGMGTAGYDNVSKKYWNTWADNMGTGMMIAEGTCDMAKKSCEFWGTYNDPVTGTAMKNRTVSTWTSADDETMQMFMPGPDGKEFKSMEIVSKRSKGTM